jgi:glycosyltransferase involved in cell wall biosynthesis
MTIGFYKLGLDKRSVKTMFGGMYDSFLRAIAKQGWKTRYIWKMKDISSVDILVLALGGGLTPEVYKILFNFRGKLILYTPPAKAWFEKSFFKTWKEKILFIYNTDASKFSKKQYNSLGILYHYLPFASDKKIFKPLKLPKFYDVVFAASALSGTGRYRYIDKLMARAKKKNWRVLLVGSGWEKYNFPFQIVAHGDFLNLLYNSAKVCINLSNDEEKQGENSQLDANNRLFDLAMAGCFQISNAPQVVEKYFSQNEVISVDEPVKWINKIEYYLKHGEKRKKISLKARQKTLNEHTWERRARIFVKAIETAINKKNGTKISIIQKVKRKIDGYIFLLSWFLKDVKHKLSVLRRSL